MAAKQKATGRPAEVDMSTLNALAGYNLRRAAARQRDRFRSVFSPYDIRPVQLTTLIILLHNQPLGQSKLGEVLEMKRANVVILLDGLQNRGLIEREPSTRDRRAYDVRLTDKGSKLTRELLAIHRSFEAELAQALGPSELEKLVTLLGRLRAVDPGPQPR